jgi:general secretion pathway protein C
MRSATLARLVPLVNGVLIIMIAYNLAQITWSLLLPAGTRMPGSQDPTPQLSAATLPGPTETDAGSIADWHLFGKLDTAKPVVAKVVKAPETKLNLRLAGIFYTQSSYPAMQPLALIAEGNNPERNYRVGDFLTDSVRIHEILADRVILARGERLEALTLPKDSKSSTASGGRRAAADSVPQTSAPEDPSALRQIDAGAIAQQLRQSGQLDLERLQDVAFPQPYLQDGQFIGFQLHPGRNRRMLQQLGLRNGDVIIELNGTRLSDPSQGMQIIQEMFSADRIDARVLRNGNEMPFTFMLN